jgi:sirohydrochlorin cobaltochelatase
LHSDEDIPAMLGIHSKSLGAASGNPHELHERSLFYSTAIGTDPMFADVIIEQAASFDRQNQELESAS